MQSNPIFLKSQITWATSFSQSHPLPKHLTSALFHKPLDGFLYGEGLKVQEVMDGIYWEEAF